MTTIESEPPAEEQKQVPALARPRRSTRYWPYERKRRIVEETMHPGMSVSIVARRHDVNANLVFCWRKLYQEGRLGNGNGEQRFIPVGVVGSSEGLPVSAARPSGLMELDLPGGVRLRVESRIEEAALRRVLRAVVSCT